MRRSILIAILVLSLALLGSCSKKETPSPAITGGAAQTGTDAQLAAKLKPGEVTPSKPFDQSSPQKALLGFFEAVNIALDPAYQAASRQSDIDPTRAKAYLEALTRLRALFVDRDPTTQIDPNTEVVAYLDTIQIKRAEVVGDPTVEGDTAKIKVKVIKGVQPEADPRYFSEESSTEATVEVVMSKVGAKWKIKDFGGLVARAIANAPRM
jgi:hypothetical protein